MMPNFLIIGAHKAGTTSIADWLRNHPEVFIPELKEPRFFAFDSTDPEFLKKPRHVFSVRTMSEYERLFDNAHGRKAIGEASPQYLPSNYACEAIYSALPQVKIIVSLRHPVLRAYSQYWMRVRLGRETRAFEAAFATSEEWVTTSFYHDNIKRYLDRFGHAQVAGLLFERLITEPRLELTKLSRFIDINPNLGMHSLPFENAGRISKFPTINKLSDNRQLSLLSRRVLPRSLVHFVRKALSRSSRPTPKLSPDRSSELMIRFLDDVYRTEDLLKMDLAKHWLK
ncbi:putative Sulfotransferase [Thiocapsa sp. KS1]|nr:sulfotransferase [Thiocapsa sp. KS1]CRI62996.1 putative Sulfotransferase [Thiocapsa sp. KS1]